MKVKEKLIKVLEDEYVCNRCLGRQFANLLSGYTNEERGEILRQYLAMLIDSGEKIEINKTNFYEIKFHLKTIKPKKPGKCSVCGDLFPKLKKKVKKIVKKLGNYDYGTFLVGSRPSSELLNKEQRLWEKVGIEWCETIKSEINRVIGKEIESSTGKVMKRKLPDITILYDMTTDEIKLNVRSIFVYGKYQKLVRDMPQTTWKTRIYPVAVEDIVAEPFMKQTKAEDHTLHGCGREDVDVKCLGWRPFVLELHNPQKREIDLKKAEKKVNKSKKVNVKDLEITNHRRVTRIKSMRPDKTYLAEVEFKEPLKNLEELEALNGTVISQKTPTRVMTRRANKTRKRRVKDIKYKSLNKKKLELTVKTEAGTYIKELIHGDEGRTQPNISELINNKVKSIKLDVIKVHCD